MSLSLFCFLLIIFSFVNCGVLCNYGSASSCGKDLGRGECKLYSLIPLEYRCFCNENYSGDACENFECFGLQNTDPGVCHSHGSCINYNYCDCSGEYFGIQCDDWMCYGLGKTNISACNGNGACIFPNYCQCYPQSGYVGRECDVLECFINETSYVCSGHGTCEGPSPNSCHCYEGYYGDECEEWDCFNEPKGSADCCGSNGVCTSPDVCFCNVGYDGSQCSQYLYVYWGKDLGGNYSSIDFIQDVIVSQNGNFIFGGKIILNKYSIPAIVFGEVEKNGTLLWSKILSTSEDDDLQSLEMVENGNFVMVGSLNGKKNPFVAKFSSDGTLIWGKKIIGGNYGSTFKAVKQTPDGGIAVCGVYYFSSTDIIFVKLNLDGVVEFSVLGDGYWQGCVDFIVREDYYIYLGYTNQYHMFGMIDSDGDFGWAKKYCYQTGYNYGDFMIETSDGGVLLSSYTRYGDYYNSLIVKMFPNNTEHWTLLVEDNGNKNNYPLHAFERVESEELVVSMSVDSSGNHTFYGAILVFQLFSSTVVKGYTLEIDSLVTKMKPLLPLTNDSTTVVVSGSNGVDNGYLAVLDDQFEESCSIFSEMDLQAVESSFTISKLKLNYIDVVNTRVVPSGLRIANNISDAIFINFTRNLMVEDVCWSCGKISKEKDEVCGGNGTCVQLNDCDCTNGYYGELCESYDCYEFGSKSKSVCGGHGNCVKPNGCSCYEYYYGHDCLIWDCYGKIFNDTEVCNYENGVCEGPNNCICEDGYFGEECELWKCNGVLYNDSQSLGCSGHGVCVSPENCVCDEGYLSQFCWDYECGGIPWNETTNVCSFGRGNCTRPNHCECVSDYYGLNCELFECYGVPSSEESKVCSGNGSCSDIDDCQCFEGHSGDNCDNNLCFDKDPSSSLSCSGHGECIGANLCYCDDHYFGSECVEYLNSFEYSRTSSTLFFTISYHLESNLVEDYTQSSITEKNSFNCSYFVQNHEMYFGENSFCYFEEVEFYGFRVTSQLILVVYEKQEKEQYQHVSGNITLMFRTISPPNKVIPFSVFITKENSDSPPPINNNNKNQGISRGLVALFISLGSSLALILLFFIGCCLSCGIVFVSVICCCFPLVLLLIGSIMLTNFRQKKRLSKFDKIEDFDLILQEHLLEKDSTVAHVRIRKELFVIDYEEVSPIRMIGSGGSNAMVFLSDWKRQKVAFKAFKTRYICSDQERFDEFEKEVELMASLQHPNIISFFGACIKPPRVGIVMEYCPNGEVLDFILSYRETRSIGYPLDEKIRMCFEIASSMEYLHDCSIIHRDLKPNNVLIDSVEHCKLMDFGLSRVLKEDRVSMTKSVGTNLYIAPEVLTGRYDKKADTYSFSILVYTLFTENSKPYGKDEDLIEFKVANNRNFRPDMKALEEKIILERKGKKDNFSTKTQNRGERIFQFLKSFIPVCWSHDPKKRYSFSRLVHMIGKFRERISEEEEEENSRKGEKNEDDFDDDDVSLLKREEMDRGKEDGDFDDAYQVVSEIVKSFYNELLQGSQSEGSDFKGFVKIVFEDLENVKVGLKERLRCRIEDVAKDEEMDFEVLSQLVLDEFTSM